MILATFAAAALAASPYRPLPQTTVSATSSTCAKERKLAAEANAGGVANLPFAMGKTFPTLDAYLTHLQCFAAPIDKPWWREVRPGVYEHMTSVTNAKREVVTRAELLKRFGFSK
jgi:hypothetical protein